MDFEQNVPEWNAEGTEPPASLKEKGFEAGYKPPAAYFNWFWNRVSACLKEIRTKLSGHAVDKNNPHGVTAEQVGLGKVNNTADSEKNVSFASEAATARKVDHNMVIRFNGGGTESTDMFTYNGSTSRSVNITPEKIGSSKKDLSNVENDKFLEKAKAAGVTIPIVVASSADGVAYTATVDGVTELYNGMLLTIIPDVVSASIAPTLNVNGLGAKMVRLPLSFNNAAMTTPRLEAYFTQGRPITLQYDANYTTGGAWKTFGKQRTSAQDLYGTVPIESGGTGAETVAGARNALGLGNTSGAVPVANGGTGAADAANARTNLGVPPTSHASSGTGYGIGTSSNYGHVKLSDATNSTSAASAGVAASPSAVKAAYDLANGKAARKFYTGTLSTSGWSSSAPYTQTVTISGILASDTPVVDLNMSSATASNAAGLQEAWACVGRIVTAANTITAYCYEDKPTVALPLNILVVR